MSDEAKAYEIHVGAGVETVLRDCQYRLQALSGEAINAPAQDYQELAERMSRHIEDMQSFVNSLVSVLCSHGEGDVRLFRDGGLLSLAWWYDSGYHGGMIFHPHGIASDRGSWSIHT